MEESRKGREFIMPYSFIAFHELCSRDAMQPALKIIPASPKDFCNGQHLAEKVRKFWDEIPRLMLPHATQEPPWFTAKPIVRNLTRGWCNARRDVRADVAVTGASLLARCTQQRETSEEFVLGCSTQSNSFQMERWERQWRAVCAPVFSYTSLLSHHLRVNQCGIVQRVKPVQAAWSAGSSLGYFQLGGDHFLTAYWKYQAN